MRLGSVTVATVENAIGHYANPASTETAAEKPASRGVSRRAGIDLAAVDVAGFWRSAELQYDSFEASDGYCRL